MVKERMNKAMPLLRRELLTDIIEYGQVADLLGRMEEAALGLAFDRPVMLIIGCRNDHKEGGRPNIASRKSDEDYAVILIAERFLSPHISAAATVYRRTYFVWFAQPAAVESAANWRQTPILAKGALELVQQACRQSLGLHLSFVIGSDPVVWGDVADIFPNMKSLLNQRLRQGSEILLATDEFYRSDAGGIYRSDGPSQRLQKQIRHLELLELLLEQGQSGPFFEAYDQLCKTLLADKAIQRRTMLHEIKQRVCLFLISFINRYALAEQLEEEQDLQRLMSGDPEQTLEETFELCRRVAEMIFGVRTAEQERRSAEAIFLVQQYIQEHLDDDLSLTSLADKMYFNPKYFSRLFHQVTGSYLSDYIHEHRLSRAKEMLGLPQYKVHEVAAAIGCKSASYFTRFFKKATQMSPQEYRGLRHAAQTRDSRQGVRLSE